MSCSPRLSVHDLRYAYPDGTPALRGVSFTVEPGEAVALVGANGAGKSTLLQHLGGCLLPYDGAVCVDGKPVSRDTLGLVRRLVGTVFQDPDDQLFMSTVFDDVAFGPLNLGLAADEVKVRVEEALALVGASALSNRPPYRLSGGEKRLAAMAAVLSMEPHTLVLDEPTSNLDPKSRRSFINLMRDMHHTRIIASHDLEMVLDICPRTIVLHAGMVLADGPTASLFQDDALLAASHLERPPSLCVR